ncbi:anti-repressor SinI family protein [Salsuginibacillus kocurii]|nr:anti-repressor SinI family protein [Salsuginibacillus kocurii]
MKGNKSIFYDQEWVELILEAKEKGFSAEEVKTYLCELKEKEVKEKLTSS